MRRAIFALMGAVCLTVPGMVGCSHESPGEDGAALGSVSLPLVMSTPSAMYRLSDATFTIDGPTPTILNSSDDPAEVELTASLGAGSYEIVLEPGWALERDGGSGFVAVSATLLSSNPRSFTIEPSTTTALTYQFETSGTVVGGDGQLTVDLQVDDSAVPTCTPFGAGCPSGSWCTPAVLGSIGCTPVGPVAPGGFCDAFTDCGANSVCLPEPDDSPLPLPNPFPLFVCTELCSAEQVGSVCPASGLTCTGSGTPGVGQCL